MKLAQPFLLLAVLLLAPLVVYAQDTKQALNDQFFEAARKGDVADVTALLDKGADVNAKFRYGSTALFKAAERGNLEVVKLLLARGADVTVKDTFYSATAMTWALNNKHVEVVRALLEKDAGAVDDILTTGTREGNVALVKMALERGGAKPETLTAALVLSQTDKDKAEITEMLKKAGAVPPPEIDAATLQSYVGKYKGETGPELTMSVKDGKFFAAATGQGSFELIAIDKTTFRPAAFAGIVIVFNVEGGKVTGLTLKQGPTPLQMKRIE